MELNNLYHLKLQFFSTLVILRSNPLRQPNLHKIEVYSVFTSHNFYLISIFHAKNNFSSFIWASKAYDYNIKGIFHNPRKFGSNHSGNKNK